MAATLINKVSSDKKVSNASQRLIKSGIRMKVLLDEMIAVNKVQREPGVRVYPVPLDMGQLFEEEMAQLRTPYPDRQLDLHLDSRVTGTWDGESLRRLLGNLVVNAVKHDDAEAPISVHVKSAEDQVTFEVRNQGTPLDAATLQGLFEPFRRVEYRSCLRPFLLGYNLILMLKTLAQSSASNHSIHKKRHPEMPCVQAG